MTVRHFSCIALTALLASVSLLVLGCPDQSYIQASRDSEVVKQIVANSGKLTPSQKYKVLGTVASGYGHRNQVRCNTWPLAWNAYQKFGSKVDAVTDISGGDPVGNAVFLCTAIAIHFTEEKKGATPP